jgi:hypothetical protein
VPTTLSSDEVFEERWQARVRQDFAGLDGVVQALVQDTGSWQSGKLAAASLISDINKDWPDIYSTRADLAKEAPFALAPTALNDYQMSVDLYIESFRMAIVAARLPPGAMQSQLQLSTSRIRELGDRIYDQATVVLSPYAPPLPNSSSGNEVIKPADVPVWASVGLAAGPPLDAPRATLKPVAFEPTRPQQSFPAWQRDVQDAGIPPIGAEVAAIESGTTATLRVESDAFDTAAEKLTAEPDPKSGRPASSRLRLGLLADAEATRAAEAATLITDPALQSNLRQIAETLAVVGDSLWDPELGPRATGFARSLLST